MTVVWIVLHAQGPGPADSWASGLGSPPPHPGMAVWMEKELCDKPDKLGRGGEVHDRLTSSVAQSNLTGWADHKLLPGQVMAGNAIPDG